MRVLGVFHYSKHILFVFLLSVLCLTLTIQTSTANSSGNERDRLALLAFKTKITHDPRGAFSSWNNSLHFCNWEGIICSHRHRRVTALDLSSKGLVGSLSPGIGNLSFLREILFSNNTLKGVIPQEVRRLFRLRVLSLSYNELEGEIPKNLSQCSNLIKLYVANNRLTGKLPIELASLSKLQELVLDFNNLTGEIPSFVGNLTSLRVLSASQNAFTGYVSVDFGSLLHLQKLRLAGNNLGSGEQGDLKFLGSLANCSGLEILELGDNNFGGSLPRSIANISTALTWINLAGNQISGSIPSEISKFINLIFLDLGFNKFTGIIPTEIVKLVKLQRVVLSNNRLLGKIPASIGNLSMLDQLQLDNNKLEGSIPPSFGNCRLLVLLDLSQNNLSGTIPNKLFDTSAFSIMLNLSQNHLVGSIPADVGRLKTLGEFDVSENELSGVIPSEIGGCTGLEKLYIQGNFIQGTIPHSMKNLRGMQDVDLSRNNFSGEIPDFMQTLSLKYLNLSWNNFGGKVPVMGVFANVNAFSVVGNKRLCGGIPELQLQRCSIDGSNKHKISMWILISIFSMPLALTIVSSFLYVYLRRRKKKLLNHSRGPSHFKVSYADLHEATNGFSQSNLVGAGSFGSVYKGILHRAEKIVAVKVFNPQLREAAKMFITECKYFRNIRHRNLVKILTVCSCLDIDGHEFRAIVYEFMEHGSLERWLHSTKNTNHDGLNKPQILNLSSRINIAIDVACALDYLHHQCEIPVVHCDLKPSNILLDKDMVAHVTDFGLAKFCPECQSADQSSSLNLRGTIGYIAPEYLLGSMVSTKGDVYSYGILLLEMLTGKKSTDPMFYGGLQLHDFVSNALPDRVMDIIDPVILQEFIKDATQMTDTNITSASKENINQMKGLIIMFKIGVKCTTESPQVRPHVSDVLSELETVRTIFKSKKGLAEPYLNNSSQAEFSMARKPMKFITQRRQKEKPNSTSILMLSSFKVSYEELHKATNGFSLTNLVGAGGFGSVYKGILDQAYSHLDLLYNGTSDGVGTVIAVKVFNLQRKSAVTSFTSECTILRNISHKNLVKIITTCTSVDEEGHAFRAIVYEFMEHGSLERWLYSAKKELHDGLNKPRILNLHTRINIAIDVASALNYLHHQCKQPIIHCDLKPSNILLDRDMMARVADFGLATFRPKLPNSDQSSSIALRGTTGYIPPEYGLGSMLSTKGDVYSFGILLLEMLIGKRPTHRMFHGGINLHNFAWMALPDRIMDITDPTMKRMTFVDENHGDQMRECLTKMFDIGVQCSKPSPGVRPDICDVLHELKSLKDIFEETEMRPTPLFKD